MFRIQNISRDGLQRVVLFSSLIGVALGTHAMAQSRLPANDGSLTLYGITLYGSIDYDVTDQTHGAPTSDYSSQGTQYLLGKSSRGSVFTIAPNGLGNSKIGLKGTEALGHGWSAVFKLETGFNPVSRELTDGVHSLIVQNGVPLNQQSSSGDSSRAGQAFNQAAYGGISHPIWGTLTFGRQTTLLGDGVNAYDPQLGTYAFSVIGYSGVAGGGGDTQDLRLDQMVKFTDVYGPIKLGLMYQASGSLGDHDRAYGAEIGARFGHLVFDGYTNRKNDAVSAASLTAVQALSFPHDSVAATISDNTTYALMAKDSFGRLTLYAGYEHITYANPGSIVTAGAEDIGGYELSVVNNKAFDHHKTLQIAWAGARYRLTPKLDAGAALYHYGQNSYRGNGCSDGSAASCSGDLTAFSVMLDYHVSKRFETYAGAMHTAVSGGLGADYLHRSTVDAAAGVRFTF